MSSDAPTMSNQSHTSLAFPFATFLITAAALFMVTLDNLVVTTALPSIRVDLGATLESLEWTVNAYTLAYAVFLLTGAALGDRFGRRRVFTIGVALFTAASAARRSRRAPPRSSARARCRASAPRSSPR